MQWEWYPVESNKNRFLSANLVLMISYTFVGAHKTINILFIFLVFALYYPTASPSLPSLVYSHTHTHTHTFLMAVTYNVAIRTTYSSSRLVYCLCGYTAHTCIKNAWVSFGLRVRNMTSGECHAKKRVNRDVNSKEATIRTDEGER